jgi:hypothetical protein
MACKTCGRDRVRPVSHRKGVEGFCKIVTVELPWRDDASLCIGCQTDALVFNVESGRDSCPHHGCSTRCSIVGGRGQPFVWHDTSKTAADAFLTAPRDSDCVIIATEHTLSCESTSVGSVFVAPSNKVGMGLFASKRYQKNDIVCQFESPWIETTEHDVERLGFPHDSIIHLTSDPRSARFDPTFETMVPAWYRINHANPANLLPAPKGERIRFCASRTIEAMEELFFDYGEPGPGWQ